MIPILAGLTAALCWGLSTVVASRSTRILGSQQALAYVMLLGLAALAVIAPVSGLPAHIRAGALAWALVAGVGSATGLALLYRAVQLGKVGVVTPIASTEGAVAALLSIALGERLTLSVALCLAVVALGVVVVTLRGSAADMHLRPSLYAFGAACFFGTGLVASAHAGDTLGALWTILIARIVGVAIITAPLIVRRSLHFQGGRGGWCCFRLEPS